MSTAEKFTDLRKIIGMRNRLVHGYDQLDLDVLWDAAVSHVPKLHQQVEAMLVQHGGDSVNPQPGA